MYECFPNYVLFRYIILKVKEIPKKQKLYAHISLIIEKLVKLKIMPNIQLKYKTYKTDHVRHPKHINLCQIR